MRRIGALLAALALVLLTAPPAVAIEPPVIDPAAVPPDETGPDQPTEQRRQCSAPISFPDSNFIDKPWANEYLRLADAQKFATGAGVTVAVIDTGVNGSARVPAEPGGDFVDKAGNGMSDCDAHGTLTAAIIAGRPAPTDGFIGVAPQARILSLRQTSDNFQPVGSRSDPNDPNTTQTAGSLRSLARSIVHAANLGAQVINISEAACYKSTRPIDEATVGAAINFAVNIKGAIVVVAAGNTGQDRCSVMVTLIPGRENLCPRGVGILRGRQPDGAVQKVPGVDGVMSMVLHALEHVRELRCPGALGGQPGDHHDLGRQRFLARLGRIGGEFDAVHPPVEECRNRHGARWIGDGEGRLDGYVGFSTCPRLIDVECVEPVVTVVLGTVGGVRRIPHRRPQSPS